MHELVKQFIDKKKAENREEKAQKLIELGIYEKEYPADLNNYSYAEYPECGYDENGNWKRYKRIPIEVSDEEYEEILKYATPTELNERNPVSKALSVIAVSTYVIGAIAGFFYIEYAFVLTLLVWVATFVSGTAILGFAEIVKLLQEIKNKIK